MRRNNIRKLREERLLSKDFVTNLLEITEEELDEIENSKEIDIESGIESDIALLLGVDEVDLYTSSHIKEGSIEEVKNKVRVYMRNINKGDS